MASLSEFFSDPDTAGTWTVDADRSTITVKSKSMWGLVPVKGKFTEFSGDGQLAAPQTVSGRLEIKAASLRTGIRKRDEHLHSADFFAADKFPDIVVVVSSADVVDGDSLDLHAQLTVKGTTKPLSLRTKVTAVGDGGMRLETRATVNRQDFGVDGNMIGMIGDTATISGDLVFRRVR
ncbi:YceI family protein [Mycobacterium sp. IDR2000157661]|uniref:YceI family protein n=1 Tax=Mycobacterium sp. IDR2000157661 TaxID=2867005 RepID=UPI001EEAF896|nr:YceI family protein [Mycobacterium sp. IDR2000157661]ULE33491.1 YceI family protein [Mycobacterium sp. IDR2000157661]